MRQPLHWPLYVFVPEIPENYRATCPLTCMCALCLKCDIKSLSTWGPSRDPNTWYTKITNSVKCTWLGWEVLYVSRMLLSHSKWMQHYVGVTFHCKKYSFGGHWKIQLSLGRGRKFDLKETDVGGTLGNSECPDTWQLLAKPHKHSVHCPVVTFHTTMQSGGKKVRKSTIQSIRT